MIPWGEWEGSDKRKLSGENNNLNIRSVLCFGDCDGARESPISWQGASPCPLPPASPGLHLQICTHQQSLDVAAVCDANEDNDSDIKYVLYPPLIIPAYYANIIYGITAAK